MEASITVAPVEVDYDCGDDSKLNQVESVCVCVGSSPN